MALSEDMSRLEKSFEARDRYLCILNGTYSELEVVLGAGLTAVVFSSRGKSRSAKIASEKAV